MVLPVYNAPKAPERTTAEVSPGIAGELLPVDDASWDDTVSRA